jgi:hypothetical protein
MSRCVQTFDWYCIVRQMGAVWLARMLSPVIDSAESEQEVSLLPKICPEYVQCVFMVILCRPKLVACLPDFGTTTPIVRAET